MAGTFFLTYDQVGAVTHLWAANADGSNAHVIPDKTLPGGGTFFNPRSLQVSNGKLFFEGQPSTDSVNDAFGELYVSDGTAAGTLLLKDIYPGRGGSSPRIVGAVGGLTLFTANSGVSTRGVYATDGTAAGTVLLSGFPTSPNTFIPLNGRTLFVGSTPATGAELWTTDGTVAGTQLLKDINPGTGSSGFGVSGAGASKYAIVGATLLFSATSPSTQAEGLWATDGTTAGTRLVKDIYPTGYGSLLDNLTAFKGKLYFSANNAAGDEIWVSDGTTVGTSILKDLVPGGVSGSPNLFTVAGDNIFFTAQNPYVTGTELYATDGTSGGTRLVKDILVGSGSSDPRQLYAIGSRVVFVADDGVHGRELWASDGTAAGTVLIADLEPGTPSGNPNSLTASNGLVFFTATDPTGGGELWVTDGTVAGTHRTRDIFAGTGGSDPDRLTAVAGGVLFDARDADHGREAWFSDGTQAGTHLVVDAATRSTAALNVVGDSATFNDLGGRIVFVSREPGYGAELWTTEGASAGAHLLKDINPGSSDAVSYLRKTVGSNLSNAAVAGGDLYFTANDTQHGAELWMTDGTDAGTSRLTDIRPGASDTIISYVTAMGGKVYFTARYDQAGNGALYVTDGTAAGTHTVQDQAVIDAQLFKLTPQELFPVGNQLFFVGDGGTSYSDATGFELWVSDGTSAGTHMVKNINPDNFSGSSIADFAAFGDKVVFTAYLPSTGREPWISDGTEAGTFMLHDIGPGSDDSGAGGFTVFGGRLYFTAANKLWSSDGTTAGTQLFSSSAGAFVGVGGLAVSNNKLFFSATTGSTLSTSTGYEPWVSDGTPGGTILLKDIYAGYGGSSPRQFTAFGAQTLFYADSGVSNGLATGGLWITDGTAAGTHPFLSQTYTASPLLAVINNRAIISYYDASRSSSHVYSVGVGGDLTPMTSPEGEAVTVLSTSSDPAPSVVGGRLVFLGSSTAGAQLWTTDGTVAGTHRLSAVSVPADIYSTPTDFVSTAVQPVAPTIGGVAALALGDHDSVQPFATVLVADPDSAALTVTLSLDTPTAGQFTPASLTAAGFTGLSFTGGPAAVQAALRQLVFAPDPFHTGPGASRAVTLSLDLSDGSATVTDSHARLTVTGTGDAPTGPVLSAASDTGVLGDGVTADTTPTFTGRADAGATVGLYDLSSGDGTTMLASVVADAQTGAFSLTPAVQADGLHQYQVRAQQGGSTLSGAASLALTIDSTAPPSPSDVALDASSSVVVPGVGRVARTLAPTVVGTAAAGSVIHLFDGAGLVGTATADPVTGAFSVVSTALSVGLHALTVTATDSAGNEGPASTAVYTPIFDRVAVGDDGANSLDGSSGRDLLLGFDGADTLAGGGGLDVLFGGAGADHFDYARASDSAPGAPDYIADFESGIDTVDLSAVSGSGVAIAYAYGETFVAFAPDGAGTPQGLIAAQGVLLASDLMLGVGVQGLSLFGSEGADTLVGLATGDALMGGGGADLLIGLGGADRLSGGAGADTFRYLAVSDSPFASPDLIQDFASGIDKIDLGAVSGSGVAIACATGETFIAFAPDGSGAPQGLITVQGVVLASDLLLGAGVQGLSLFGSEGADTLVGLGTGDAVTGGGGDDLLIGGGGADRLSGGAGADTFRYLSVSDSTPASTDLITDFEHGIDKIDLTAVAGGVVNIVHDGAGGSILYYAPDGAEAGGVIDVSGDVEDADVIVSAGTIFIDTGAFAGAFETAPDPQPAVWRHGFQPLHALLY